MRALRGRLSGLCQPEYVLDIPGGHGKSPVGPNYLTQDAAGRTQVLIGTQMIAKGLDFPNVTLVGVVNADTALHLPDFRAAERTFQLLVQAAGRTGRGAKGGRVLIQTLNPDHRAVIVLRHFVGLSYDEMGDALGVPSKTVKSRLHSARQRLGELLLGWKA